MFYQNSEAHKKAGKLGGLSLRTKMGKDYFKKIGAAGGHAKKGYRKPSKAKLPL